MQESNVVSGVAEDEKGNLEAIECSIRNEERPAGKSVHLLMFGFWLDPALIE